MPTGSLVNQHPRQQQSQTPLKITPTLTTSPELSDHKIGYVYHQLKKRYGYETHINSRLIEEEEKHAPDSLPSKLYYLYDFARIYFKQSNPVILKFYPCHFNTTRTKDDVHVSKDPVQFNVLCFMLMLMGGHDMGNVNIYNEDATATLGASHRELAAARFQMDADDYSIEHGGKQGIAIPGACFHLDAKQKNDILIQWICTSSSKHYNGTFCKICKYVFVPDTLIEVNSCFDLNNMKFVSQSFYDKQLKLARREVRDSSLYLQCWKDFLTVFADIGRCSQQHYESERLHVLNYDILIPPQQDPSSFPPRLNQIQVDISLNTPAVFSDIFVLCKMYDNQNTSERFISYTMGDTFKRLTNDVEQNETMRSSSVHSLHGVNMLVFDNVYYNMTSMWLFVLLESIQNGNVVGLCTAVTLRLSKCQRTILTWINRSSLQPSIVLDADVLETYKRTQAGVYDAPLSMFTECSHKLFEDFLFCDEENEDVVWNYLDVTIKMLSQVSACCNVYYDSLRMLYQVCALCTMVRYVQLDKQQIDSLLSYLSCLGLSCGWLSNFCYAEHDLTILSERCESLFEKTNVVNTLLQIDRLSVKLRQNVFTYDDIIQKAHQSKGSHINNEVVRWLVGVIKYGLF